MPAVKAEVERLQAEAAEAQNVTLARLYSVLSEACSIARKKESATGMVAAVTAIGHRMALERPGAGLACRSLLRLVDRRMRQWAGVINDGAQVAYVNPPAAVGASDVVISGVLRKMA